MPNTIHWISFANMAVNYFNQPHESMLKLVHSGLLAPKDKRNQVAESEQKLKNQVLWYIHTAWDRDQYRTKWKV